MSDKKWFDIEDMRDAVRDYYSGNPDKLEGFWGNGDEDPDKVYEWVVDKIDYMTATEVVEEYVNTVLKDEPNEIPGFEGTRDQLDSLTLKRN